MKPKDNTIPESTFKKAIINHNSDLHTYGLKEWVFYPGMLFKEMEAWWTDTSFRPAPHEGIDLRLYRDDTGQVRNIDRGTKIPAMYTGDIVRIHDDFLGKTIYVKHRINDNRGNALHTIYGHTTPEDIHVTGKRVREGDIIAEIAALSEDSKIPPHIHLTMAWIPESFPSVKLSWDVVGNSRLITLCNPLEHIDIKNTATRKTADQQAL